MEATLKQLKESGYYKEFLKLIQDTVEEGVVINLLISDKESNL